MNSELRLEEVAITLNGHALFDPLSLSVAPGEIVSLMGPSGCGKSTLLAHLCGTLAPSFSTSGQLFLGQQQLDPLPTEKRQIGILFQDPLLFPHLSVAENLAFALPADKRGDDRQYAISQALAEAELPGFGDRPPKTLSGGQQARVALMRTLLAQPRALLLDEPFSKLDPELRDRIRRFVFEHARERQIPVLMVTHDPLDAEMAGGRVLELHKL